MPKIDGDNCLKKKGNSVALKAKTVFGLPFRLVRAVPQYGQAAEQRLTATP
jgi:hypothetical protein